MTRSYSTACTCHILFNQCPSDEYLDYFLYLDIKKQGRPMETFVPISLHTCVIDSWNILLKVKQLIQTIVML